MSAECQTFGLGDGKDRPGSIKKPDTTQRSVSMFSVDSHSSKEGNVDDMEPEHEIPDISDLDRKLDHVSIMKVDTNLFAQDTAITARKHAEQIIKQIVKTKRKHNEIPAGPREKKFRLDSKAADITDPHKPLNSASPFTSDTGSLPAPDILPLTTTSHAGIQVEITSEYKQDISEIKLKEKIKRILKAKGIKYDLKIYLVEGKQESSFSKSIAKLVTEKSRSRLYRENEVNKSYIILFYRNVESTIDYTTDSASRLEMFAITTGSAWQIVSKYAEKDFTKLIEKRTLQFSLEYIELKPDCGLYAKQTDLVRPGHEIIFTIWNVLGKLIGNRTRKIRKLSSLHAFLTKDGKQANSKFSVGEKSLKIMCKLSIPQLGSILEHFSKIYMGKKTYLLNKEEEEDDPRFEIYDFMVNVIDKELIHKLNKHLYKELQEILNGKPSSIVLSHPSFFKWATAEAFHLKARTLTKTTKMASKRRNKIRTWNEYPRLDEILECLRTECGDEFKKEWLDDVMIKFHSIEAPLKKCIFNNFTIPDIGTYIYDRGLWIEMTAQYLYNIEIDFVEQMKSHFLEPSQLPLLLPWKNPGKEKQNNTDEKDGDKMETETNKKIGENKKKKEKKEKKKNKEKIYNLEQMKPRWKKHYENVCRGDFDKVSKVLDDAEKVSPEKLIDPKPNFHSLKEKSAHEKAAHLYRILECEMEEKHYNQAHTLLNMILPDETHVLSLDRREPHNIELCDILIYDDKTTYIVHVKAVFGGPIRVVCSQIRNAADNIYRIQKMSKGIESNHKDLIDEYWEILTKNSSDSHEIEVKLRLENMTKEKFKQLFLSTREIVFVLACRDTNEGKSFSHEIIQSCDLKVHVRDKIMEKFTENDSNSIISQLIEEGYLTDQETLTDKFILEGKDKKTDFIKKLKTWDVIKPKNKAIYVAEALLAGLHTSKSTLAKMEIIRLVQDFQKYSVDKRMFRLKIFDIQQDFPDLV